MRRLVSLALLVCAAAMAFAAVSAAHTKNYAVHTTVKKSGKTIAGTLSSSKAKCIKDRTFGVGYKTHTGGYGPYVVHSDESGHWKLGGDLSGKGEVLVDVIIHDLTITHTRKHKHACKNVHAQKVLTF
jgi:uncharacterized low-complexity protein